MDWLHVKEFHGIFSTKRFPQRIDKRSSSQKNALRSREQQTWIGYTLRSFMVVFPAKRLTKRIDERAKG